MKKNYPNNVFEEALKLYGVNMTIADRRMIVELSKNPLNDSQLENFEYVMSLNKDIEIFNLYFKENESYPRILAHFKNIDVKKIDNIIKKILNRLVQRVNIEFIYSGVGSENSDNGGVLYNINIDVLGLSHRSYTALIIVGIESIGILQKFINENKIEGLLSIKKIGIASANEIIEKMIENGYIVNDKKSLYYQKPVHLTKETKITDTGLSCRIINALTRHGITNISTLISIVKNGSITSIPDIGEVSSKEITDFLIKNKFIKPESVKSVSCRDTYLSISSERVKKLYEGNIKKFSITDLPYPINLIQLIDESLLMKWKDDIINNIDNRKGYEIILRVETMVETLTLVEQYAIKYFLSGTITKSELYTKYNKSVDFDHAYTMAIRKLKHPYRFRIISGEIDTDELFKNNAEKNYFNDIKNIDIAELDVEHIDSLYPNLFEKIDKAIPDCTVKQLRDIIEENPKYWYEREEFHELSGDFKFNHKEFIPINIRFINYLIFIGLIREDKIKDKINLKSI